MFPQSGLGSKLRKGDPVSDRNNIRDIFGDRTFPSGSLRERFGRMSSGNMFDSDRERPSNPPWPDNEDSMRMPRKTSGFSRSSGVNYGRNRAEFFKQPRMFSQPMSPGGQNNGQIFSDTTGDSHEPKVHHIHVNVEPRGDQTTQKGERSNTPENTVNLKQMSKQEENNLGIKNKQTNQESNFSQVSQADQQIPQSLPPKQINQNRIPPDVPPKTKKASEIVIPVQCVVDTPEHDVQTNGNTDQIVNDVVNGKRETLTPENKANSALSEIKQALTEMEEEVKEFNGEKGDREYLYLDEMLTRLLIKLDDINTNGSEDIRALRKSTVKDVSKLIQQLENSANKERADKSSVEDERRGSTKNDKLEAVETSEAKKQKTRSSETIIWPPQGSNLDLSATWAAESKTEEQTNIMSNETDENTPMDCEGTEV